VGLQRGRNRISLGGMPKKPRAGRVVDAQALKIAAMIDQAVKAQVGPNATFEERQDVAAAVMGEVIAALRESGARGPKTGS
jgi:hypothetical protein